MYSFYSKIAGVTFDNRQELIEELYDSGQLNVGQQLILVRDRYNRYDNNAVAVMHPSNRQLGFLSKDVASNVAPKMDRGTRYVVEVSGVTGVDNYGVNIRITEV